VAAGLFFRVLLFMSLLKGDGFIGCYKVFFAKPLILVEILFTWFKFEPALRSRMLFATKQD
jgi:hypothetical protein